MILNNIRLFLKFYSREIISIALAAFGYVLYISLFYSTEVLFLASLQGDVQLAGKFLDGTFALKDLIRRYGEHGLLGYDILLILNTAIFKLTTRFDMILNILNVFASGLLLVYCASQTANNKNAAYYVGIALISIVMFSPMQGSSATMETQVRLGLMCFLFGAYFVSNVLLKTPGNASVVGAVALLFIGTNVFGTLYNFAGLPMIFLLLLLFTIKTRKVTSNYVILALTYIASVFLYLYMYGLLDRSSGLPSGSLLQSLLFWLSNPLLLAKSIIAYNASAVLGESGYRALLKLNTPGIWLYLLAGLVVTVIYLYSLLLFIKTKMYDKTVFPLLLLSYSFFVLILAIIGRHQYGADWSWGINQWYHVHTKLGLAASIWIISCFLSHEKSWVLESPQKPSMSLNAQAAWISILILSIGLLSGISASIIRAPRMKTQIQNMAKYMYANSEDMPIDKDGNTPLMVDKASTIECLQILKENKLSVFASPSKAMAPGIKIANKSNVLSGMYYDDGWISKEIELKIPADRRGHFWGRIIFPNADFVSNGITITINDTVCFTHKYTIPGNYFFESKYVPNNDTFVKIQLDKAIVPKKLGIGEDTRELAGILPMLVFE